MGKNHAEEHKPSRPKTPTFLLELPLLADAGQAARVRAHLEVGREFYNAVLSAGQQRLRRMRADPAWQAARAIPRTQKEERRATISALRERYGFSEYAFHELARKLRVAWLAEHLDAVLAQTLATRAYRALNRVCLGMARRVRFKSRGLDSIETQGQRRPQGYLLWHDNRLPALIDWDDPVVAHGLAHEIKYARLVRRRASSPELYDERGRPKKRAKGAPRWKESRSYQASRRRKATRERKLAAHRKSLHGRLAHQIVAVGHTIVTEKISFRGWQKRYGKSVGRCAPGLLIDHLKRTVVSTGGTLHEVPTLSTKLSQYCQGCGRVVKKPLSQRWHQCPCGVGPVQRDLYSAFLAAFLDPADPNPSCAQYTEYWEGAEARLVAAHERVTQRAKEGQVMPRSMGIPRAGARLTDQSGRSDTRAAFPLQQGKVEAWKHRSEPPVLQP